MLYIILSKASGTIGTLAGKVKTFLPFFVLSPDNEFLVEMTCFLLVKIWLYYVSLAKSVVLSKQFASFNRRKLLCKLKVSSYRCKGKTVWENKSRYITSILIIYHCYHRINLIAVFHISDA